MPVLTDCMTVQGVLFCTTDCIKNTNELIRLWLHEAERVYKDKLVDPEDITLYDKILKDILKKNFEVSRVTFHTLVDFMQSTRPPDDNRRHHVQFM